MNRFALILMFAVLLLMSAIAKHFEGPPRCLRPKPVEAVSAQQYTVPAQEKPVPPVRHLPRVAD